MVVIWFYILNNNLIPQQFEQYISSTLPFCWEDGSVICFRLVSNLHPLQEDFEAERRDRERMASEKETDKLRANAEITSLKLQVTRQVILSIP